MTISRLWSSSMGALGTLLPKTLLSTITVRLECASVAQPPPPPCELDCFFVTLVAMTLARPAVEVSCSFRVRPSRDLAAALFRVPGRHVREQEAQPLGKSRMGENGVPEPRIWQISQHRRLHHRHHFAGRRADHGEPEDAVVALPDKNLHQAVLLAGRL